MAADGRLRPASDRFLAAVRSTHLVASSCELLFPGETESVTVPIEGGDVTIDRTALIRRTASVQIPWSLEAGHDLGLDLRALPLGGYARLRRGIRYADGTREFVALGHFRVESVTWKTTDERASLELADRMAQVRDEPFTTPYSPVDTGASITRTGTLTHGSPIVTGLSTTADLSGGMNVSGIGLPPGTTIASINSGSQITLSQPANLFAQKDVAGLPNNAVLKEIDGTDNLIVGMIVNLGNNSDGQPMNRSGTTTIASIDSDSQITMSQPTANVTFRGPGYPGGYARAQFTAPATQTLTFGGGKRIADAALDIVAQVFGTTIEYRKLYDPNVILTDVFYSQNRGDAVSELAAMTGGETYFDANGAYVFDVIAGEGPPVWDVDAGTSGVLIDADESLDRTSVYNGVLVSGQASATDAPVSALVVDDDPASPTLWGGPFGKVARIEQSSAVQTVPQAEEAAAALLADRLGLTRSLTLTQAPNPALEAGDIVRVVFPDGRDEIHVLDAIRIPLGADGAQTLVTRSTDPGAASMSREAPRRFGVHYARAAWLEVAGARRVAA